jgi:tRNA (adenine57-N1/adenine58-N1)-methyltransferase catalytic subunit
MNFSRQNPPHMPRVIQDGDLVILYERFDSLQHTWMQKGGETQNRFGTFLHDDIIGKPFGYKATSSSTQCWQYVLEPSPELWSNAFKTRTQIVNEMDQSLVTTMLNVKPGDIVVESGTGSGCMTLSLMRAVSHPDHTRAGHVNTYEYNAFRAEEATKEFKGMDVDHLVTVRCQDVCIPGETLIGSDEAGHLNTGDVRGFPGVKPGTVDAMFLDVPEPYKAIHYAKALLKPNKVLCCYSPCISQVIDTCAVLRELGFTGIRMIEYRQRPADARRVAFETINLSEDEEEPETTDTVKSEEREESPPPIDIDTDKLMVGQKRKNCDNNNDKIEKHTDNTDEVDSSNTTIPVDMRRVKNGVARGPTGKGKKGKVPLKANMAPPLEYNVYRHLPSMKSHTAFLTFASSPLPDFDINIEKKERKNIMLKGREAGDATRGRPMPQGLY